MGHPQPQDMEPTDDRHDSISSCLSSGRHPHPSSCLSPGRLGGLHALGGPEAAAVLRTRAALPSTRGHYGRAHCELWPASEHLEGEGGALISHDR